MIGSFLTCLCRQASRFSSTTSAHACSKKANNFPSNRIRICSRNFLRHDMKLLLFSDLHADRAAASRLVKLSETADVVIGAGDFGNMRHDISACIEVLRQIRVPAVLVPGNNESYDELVKASRGWTQAMVLHGTGKEISGQNFFGIGGGIPITPFGAWSYDFSEADAEHLLKSCPHGAVLISHSPPKGAVDRASSGQSLGSTAVRDAILRTKPSLVVCGHIHASGGQKESIGATPVVNAGPSGMLWELSGSPANQL